MDYRSVGLPDVSYHGLKTWCPMFDRFLRQLGILYCGKYGKSRTEGRTTTSTLRLTCTGNHMSLPFPTCRRIISGIRPLIRTRTR